MHRRLGLFLIMVVLLSTFAVATAQESLALTETFTSEDGLVSFSYPAEWAIDVRESVEGEYLSAELSNSQSVIEDRSGNSFGPELESGEVYASLGILDLAPLEDVLEGVTAESPVEDVLQTIIDLSPPEEIVNFSDVTTLEIAGRPAARVSGETQYGGNGVVLFMELGDGVMGGVILTTADELEAWEPTALAIAESMTFSQDGAITGAALELSETYTTPDGTFSLDYPADWVLKEDEARPGITMSVSLGSSQSIIDDTENRFDALVPPGEFLMQVGLGDRETITTPGIEVPPDASAFQILEAVRPLLMDSRMTMGEVTEATIGDYSAAVIEGEGEDSAVLVGMFELNDNDDLLGVFIINSAPGELDLWRETALAIVGSIRQGGEEATPEPTAEGTTEAALDLTDVYSTASGGLTVSIPDGWLGRDGNGTAAYVANTQSGLDASFGDVVEAGDAQVYVWVTTAEEVGESIGLTFSNEDAPQKVLQAFTKAVPDLAFGIVEALDIDGKRGALVRYSAEGAFEGAAWVIEYQPGLLVLVQLIAAPGESGDWEGTALAIGQSAEFTQ